MAWGTAGTVATQPIGANQTWESPVIASAGGRMLINLRWEGKRSPSLNIKRTIGGIAVYAHDFARLSVRQESANVWVGTSDVPLPDMSIVAFNDGPDGVLSWSMTPWIESGGTGGSLSDADKAAIAKIATIETQLSEVVTNFSEEGQELTAGENVEQGDTRTYTVGGATFTLENRLKTKRKVNDPIDVTELNRWLVKSQFVATATAFPANALIPKGFNLKHTDGSILINKSTRVTGAEIDLTQWDTEVNSFNVLNDWIVNANDDYAVGDKLLRGDDRRITVGTTPVRITYRGADKTAATLTAAELANWEIIPNSPATAYPGAVLAPKGFVYYRSETGQLLQLTTDRTLPAAFDAGQWASVSSTLVKYVGAGETFNVLSLPTIAEKFVFFQSANIQNGVGNATYNATGFARYPGDGKNGPILMTILTSSNPAITVGEWQNTLTTTTVNSVDTQTWSGWTEYKLERPWGVSSANGEVYTGTRVVWDLTHNIIPFRIDSGKPITLKPKTTWADYRAGSLRDTGGAVLAFNGTFPASGTGEVLVTWRNATPEWTVAAVTPIDTSVTPTPVALPSDLAAIVLPKEGDRRFVRSADFDYQFTKAYLMAVTGASTETMVNPRAVFPGDGTTGVWRPETPDKVSDAWVIPTTNRNDVNAFYRRKFYGGAVRSISFEVNEPATVNLQTTKKVITIANFAAVIAGTETVPEQFSKTASSGFYGGPAVFIRPVVGGVTSIVVVAVKADGTVFINNVNLAETATGLIRRVLINGVPADPVALQSIEIPVVPTITGPNLADLSLGTFDTSGDTSGGFVSNRAGARLESLNFVFRDRRTTTFPTRSANVVLNGSDFTGAVGTGWTYQINNTPPRNGIYRDVTLDGVVYGILVQWLTTPTGTRFYFQDLNNGSWNTTGRFENVTIKWSAT
jgi:hypothetical protein